MDQPRRRSRSRERSRQERRYTRRDENMMGSSKSSRRSASQDRGDSRDRKSYSIERRRRRSESKSRSRSPPVRKSDRSRSPHRHRHGHHHRSHRPRSRSPKRRRLSSSRSKSPAPRSRKALPSQDQSYRGEEVGTSADALDKRVEKQKPNYKPTGLLAAETNKVRVSGGVGNNPKSIVLKYHEPAEARKPPLSQQWSAYVFKGDAPDPIHTIPLYTRSCWLLGREAAVADIPTEHPSCSKQHAVFQFRYVTKKDEWGEKKGKVGLYVIDLESANGTFLNGEKIEQARYVECLDKDVVKFGESEREFVILLPTK